MKLEDFELDPTTGLRHPPHAGTPAGYLDGGEQRLAGILETATDRSSDSRELQAHIGDWVTEYHLSPYRSTLLDAIGLRGTRTKALELGAGCGAITRWLGEHCAEVHAVEGDASRARVARLRTEDQDHVNVYAGNYSELSETRRFDLVTLIGVLEYGHHYHPQTDDPLQAAALNLKAARAALKDDGVLVLAIENKVGLKYLNGAREDHSGRPYDSVTGYPGGGPAQTFNHAELSELIRMAGFTSQVLLLPFPDYKLARTIVNADQVRPNHAIHNWVGQPAPDRGAARAKPSFDETLAIREINRAGLLPQLANSFEIVAFAGEVAPARERLGIDLDWVARHWSLDRRPAFAKRATMRSMGPGAVVDHEPAAMARTVAAREERARVGAATGVRQRLGAEPFRRGDLLSLRAHEALAAEGIGDRMTALVAEHADWLQERYGTGETDEAGQPQLEGRAFDATWWNIVVEPSSGAFQAIDEEWELAGPIPLDAVLRRTLSHFAQRNRIQLPAPWDSTNADEFAAHVLAVAGRPLDEGRRAVLEAFELATGRAVGPFGAEELQVDRVHVLALALAEEAIDHPALLAAYAQHFGEDDPVTLVLYAPQADEHEVAGRLNAAMLSVGLDAEHGPDLMLLAPAALSEAGEAVVARGVAGVIGTADCGSRAFADLPRFSTDGLPALSDLVARWTAPAR